MTKGTRPLDVILSDGGVVTSTDVQRSLRLQGILVRRVRFGVADQVQTSTVPWVGTGVRDEPVHGTLAFVVDAGSRYVLVEGRLEAEAGVTRRPDRSIHGDPRALLPREAAAVEMLARDALRQAQEQPGCAAALVAYLAQVWWSQYDTGRTDDST